MELWFFFISIFLIIVIYAICHRDYVVEKDNFIIIITRKYN
jgi:hypothetical protein